MQRVLEPEVMDTPEEARDYDAMDHSGVNRVFVADFLAIWDGKGPILDVGTGTAQIPLELCRQNFDACLVAVDLAEHMLAVARENIHRARLEGRVEVRRCDAKGLPFPDGEFGAVISNSIVHHIPEPSAVLTEMVRVAAPGAWLFVRDLIRPASTAQLDAFVDAYAGLANAHQRKMFADSLHAALTVAEVRELVATLGFARDEVCQTTDRHWTWAARKPV